MSEIYGTFVLGVDIEEIPELIDEGVDGKLFRSGDVQDLRNKIFKLCSDENIMEKYKQN